MDCKELENLITYYKEKKLAHAYLIATNNTNKCLKILLNVIKNIFCVSEYQDNCNKCSLCHLIDLNNLPSLKIIYPDGNFIKKKQILELKNLFSKDSIYTKESIYIIMQAEKMNKEATNTMLKFLEEPLGNVIGFFITNDEDNVMATIRSRCQLIIANFDTNIYENYNIDEEKYQILENVVNDYLKSIEIEKKELILYNRKYLSDLEKDDIKIILQIMLSIYQRKLESKYLKEKKNNNFKYLDHLSVDNLKRKINLLIELLKEINYNVNLELLLDKMVLEIEAINDETL